MALLELKNLHVAIEDGTEIVQGVDLAVDTNEVHAVMGPNGSGKSTLAYALMGHPAYEITEGDILLDGESLVELEADERAQRGLFLAFQYPYAVPGVTVANFLRSAVNAMRKAKNGGEDNPISVREFRSQLTEEMDQLKVPREMIEPLPERGLLGRREEAGRDPPDGDAQAADRGPGRDRLGSRHRRAQGRRRGRQGARRPGHGRSGHHALPAHPQLHRADFVHVFVDGRIVESGRPRAGAQARGGGLRRLPSGDRCGR